MCAKLGDDGQLFLNRGQIVLILLDEQLRLLGSANDLILD